MSDYPDWFGFQMFPSYGPFYEQEHQNNSVAAGATTTIFTLSLKGKIYGGFVYLYDNIPGTNQQFKITIDGNLVTLPYFDYLKLYGHHVDFGGLMKLTYYDILEGDFAFALMRDITFGSTFLLQLYNNTASPTSVVGQLYYSKVE